MKMYNSFLPQKYTQQVLSRSKWNDDRPVTIL